MIDYHAHLAPESALSVASAKRFMPFPNPWPPALTDLSIHIAQMDEFGFQLRYLSVPPILYGYELPVDEQVDHARTLNEWLVEAADHPRFRVSAILPLSDLDQAVAELNRVVEMGVRSIAIGTHVNGVPLDVALDDRFWAAVAEKLDFVLLHPWKVRGTELFGEHGLGNPVGNPVETTVAAARLISTGVLSRHREARILLAHGGGSLPFLLGRIRQAWASAGRRYPDPAVEARRFLYDTVVFAPEQLRHLIDVAGIEQVVMGTDSPFDMSLDDPIALIEDAGFAIGDFSGERIRPAGGAALEAAGGSFRTRG